MLGRQTGSSRRLSKKINWLLIAVAVLALGYSSISALLKGYTFRAFIVHESILTLLFGLSVVLIGHFLWPSVLRYLHIFILTLSSLLSILSKYNSFYSIGQVIVLVLLLYKYGFLDRHIKIKLLIISLCFILAVEASVFHSDLSGIGIDVFFYMAYFITFLYIIFKDEIDGILSLNNQIHSRQIIQLEKEKERIGRQLERFRAKLEEVNKAIEWEVRSEKDIDWDRYGLTKTERRIITILVSKNASNRDIGEELNIKERTVKTHLYNIYNKIGIGTRSELIGMFYSLSEKEREWAIPEE